MVSELEDGWLTNVELLLGGDVGVERARAGIEARLAGLLELDVGLVGERVRVAWDIDCGRLPEPIGTAGVVPR